jgi:hypothetical protein
MQAIRTVSSRHQAAPCSHQALARFIPTPPPGSMKIPPDKHPLDSHYAATRVFRAIKQVLTRCSPLHHPSRYLAVTRRVTQLVVILWSPERSPMWSPAVYPCVPHVTFGGHPSGYPCVTRVCTLMVFRAVTLVSPGRLALCHPGG